jgi:polyisoprenyl-phosphate glycosyltransferase
VLVSPPVGAPGLVILVPIFNDWAVADLTLAELDRALANEPLPARVVLVDDGSTQPMPEGFAQREFQVLRCVEVLSLRRNLGHQRAIAVGLAFVHADRPCEIVVVMDGDGEDAPSDVPRLLARLREQGGTRIIFAARTRRSENLVFRAGYQAFKIVHLVLVGLQVKVGNFSAIPRRHLERLVVISEVWNHYAAAVIKARLPHDTIDTTRGRRLAGRSSMNLVSMVVHGLSAMAVYGEIIGVRLLCTTFGLIVVVAAVLAAAALGRPVSLAQVPAWAALAAGTLLVMLAQAVVMAFVFVFIVLGSRAGLSFLPIRDYAYFVGEVRTLSGRDC